MDVSYGYDPIDGASAIWADGSPCYSFCRFAGEWEVRGTALHLPRFPADLVPLSLASDDLARNRST